MSWAISLIISVVVASPPPISTGSKPVERSPTDPSSTPKLRRVFPRFEGGSVVVVGPAGRLEVRDERSGQLRWSIGLGGPPDHVAGDAKRLYVASGRFLRSFAGGSAGWALDMGAQARSLALAGPDLLRVGLPLGTGWVDAAQGRFCTPRVPCTGLPSWSFSQIGVPFLDLPGLGFPGLSLAVNPALLDGGDFLFGAMPPGPVPGFVRSAPAPHPAPKARNVQAGPDIRLEKGRSAKVRTISAGGVVRSPAILLEDTEGSRDR